MKKKSFKERAYKEELFLTDGFSYYRTKPSERSSDAFRVFVRTDLKNVKEQETSFSNNHFNKMIVGEEICYEIPVDEYWNALLPNGIDL